MKGLRPGLTLLCLGVRPKALIYFPLVGGAGIRGFTPSSEPAVTLRGVRRRASNERMHRRLLQMRQTGLALEDLIREPPCLSEARPHFYYKPTRLPYRPRGRDRE